MALEPGSRLGHYEIVAALGAGGMGVVHRARDLRLGREVALKVLPDALCEDAAFLARFEQEARTVANLNHPNIVTLFSIEEEDGTRFLTMELVEGEGLESRVRPGGMPCAEVVELGIALADALAAAHAQGVVHRDLKPDNVMLTREGRVKILDFGLAKHEEPADGDDAASAATVATPRTQAGQILGTLPYMAPEQVGGGAVDGRTDVFALGVVLHELAAGTRPFAGDTPAALGASILRDDPPALSGLQGEAAPDLERIVQRCLAKDPRVRFQTALDVANELRLLQEGRVAPPAVVKMPPVPSTPLLGRDDDLTAATARLREGARVLTVTGYGGTGKTRFAMELFRRLAPDHSGGAAFISLASVTAAPDVLPTIALALEIAEAHGRSALDAVCTTIGDRPVLLVLDNLEQVLDAAGDIADLASRCPGLQIIATSRAPLKIGAEGEFELPPLDFPVDGPMTPDTLRDSSAVALFVQRAEKVKPGFALTEANAAAVAGICRKLDGLPLALELAAARARILEPEALLQRLDHALDLLTSGDRDLPLRQRTLRATISWSYSLLEPDEKRLLERLSVFHEGWTLDALEQVCFDEDERWRALDHLDSLAGKGLVRVTGAGERYTLLETIRAFAAEQLHAAGQVEDVRNAHADHFLDFAAAVAADIRGTDQVAAVQRARAESANIQAALQWFGSCARIGDESALEKALLLGGHMNWVWHIGGQHLTAVEILLPLIDLGGEREPSRGRALAELAAGMALSGISDFARTSDQWSAAREDGRKLAAPEIQAEGAVCLGYLHLGGGNFAEGRQVFDEALALSAGGVDDFLQGLALTLKGMLLFLDGDPEAGRQLVLQAHAIQEPRDDMEGVGLSLSFLAQMEFARGEPERALDYFRESLASFASVGDRPEVARLQCEIGWALLGAGDARAAGQSFRQAVHSYEVVGSPRGSGQALLGLAAVEAAGGRSETAVKIAAAAQALSTRAGVVIDHPMDPTVVERIEALKAAIPDGTLDGLEAGAASLSVGEVLAMLDGDSFVVPK